MNYCKLCLQPDTRPNTKFSETQICPACNYAITLQDVDWESRKVELDEIVAFGKENNSSGYDCIIGVSGGKDSTRQAIYVKEVLKMNPLLVCLAPPPQQVTMRGVNNISNLINLGFDCITINPAPVVWKNLMHLSFYEYVNPFKSTELALFSSVPRLAIAYQIPLIWWGENSALQLGELSVMGKTGSDGNNLKKMNTLGGGDITWILNKNFSKKEILQYCYPSDDDMERVGLRITFLGYFWKDWSLIDNGNYAALRGLDVRRERPENIGEHVGVTALDEDWTPMNQMLKYLKYGFGRTTDYVNEDIRLGRISREEGIKVIEQYDGTCSTEYIQSFCDFIEINLNEFWTVVDCVVNKKLFKKISEGKYQRLFKVGDGIK
jgi:N-acetyl sugar amidotransferase